MNKIGTMDLVLIVMGIFIVAFTVCMIILYIFTGDIPNTLCSCVFGTCSGEGGFMAVIKAAKEIKQIFKKE